MVNYSIYFCFQNMILSTMEMLKWMIIVRISGHCLMVGSPFHPQLLFFVTTGLGNSWLLLFIYIIFILYFKSHVQSCFISLINSGLFYKWACGFKRENSSRKWKWHLATLKPSFRSFINSSLPTIFVSFPTFHDAVTMDAGHVGDRSSSWFENAAFCCMFVVIWLPTLSSDKLSVVWFFNFQVLSASGKFFTSSLAFNRYCHHPATIGNFFFIGITSFS